MTLDRFKQVCENYGLEVSINTHCKDEKGEYFFARAFFKKENVAFFDKRKVWCFKHPTIYRYLPNCIIIDKGKATEIFSTSELEENIVQIVSRLKKLLIRIKMNEIDNDFE